MLEDLVNKLIDEVQAKQGEDELEEEIEIEMAIDAMSSVLRQIITPELEEALKIEYYFQLIKEATVSTKLTLVDKRPIARFFYRKVRFNILFCKEGKWRVWNNLGFHAWVESAKLTECLLLELGKIRRTKQETEINPELQSEN